MMNLNGAVVVITGASSGIGAAAVRAFAAAGARVVLVARSEGKLRELAESLPGNPLALPADVSDPAACAALVEQVVSRCGRLDVLVNNAGIGVVGPVESLELEEVRRVLATNLLGPLALVQAAIPPMRTQGRGVIINVSSVLGKHALPYAGGYAASKAALDRLTEALRMELRGSGVAVSLVRPGTTRTSFNERRLGHGQEIRRMVPPGVAPEAVARVLVRVARNEPREAYVTWKDALQVLVASLVPALTDHLLAWTFGWKSKGDEG